MPVLDGMLTAGDNDRRCGTRLLRFIAGLADEHRVPIYAETVVRLPALRSK
jgi:hypothetical protein